MSDPTQQSPWVNPAFYQEPAAQKKPNTAIWITLIIAVALVLMCGCLALLGLASSPEGTVAQPTRSAYVESTKSNPAVDDMANKEAMFVAVVRNAAPKETRDSTDAELVQLGKQSCKLIKEANGDVEKVALDLYADGADMRFSGTVMGAAVGTFCPQYTDEFNDFTDKYSN